MGPVGPQKFQQGRDIMRNSRSVVLPTGDSDRVPSDECARSRSTGSYFDFIGSSLSSLLSSLFADSISCACRFSCSSIRSCSWTISLQSWLYSCHSSLSFFSLSSTSQSLHVSYDTYGVKLYTRVLHFWIIRVSQYFTQSVKIKHLWILRWWWMNK